MLKRANLPFEVRNNEWYQVVIQREGNSIRAKAWPFGEDEPKSWQVTVEDQFIQHGKVGVLHLTDGVINDWAFFGVGTLGEKAPRAPEDLFAPKVEKSELKELVDEI